MVRRDIREILHLTIVLCRCNGGSVWEEGQDLKINTSVWQAGSLGLTEVAAEIQLALTHRPS